MLGKRVQSDLKDPESKVRAADHGDIASDKDMFRNLMPKVPVKSAVRKYYLITEGHGEGSIVSRSNIEIGYRELVKKEGITNFNLTTNDGLSFGIDESFDLSCYKYNEDGNREVIFVAKRTVNVLNRRIKLPRYWTPNQTHTGLVEDVPPESREYKLVEKDFLDGINKGEQSFRVCSVKRVQNILALTNYENAKESVIRKQKRLVELAKEDKIVGSIKHVVLMYENMPVETWLYHGAHGSDNRICSDGFSSKYSKNTNMLGRGLYGAENPLYCDNYSSKYGDLSGSFYKTMFLGRFLTGLPVDMSNMSHPALKDLPIIPTKEGFYCYDSVSNIQKTSDRVYRTSHAYPDYRIHYEEISA